MKKIIQINNLGGEEAPNILLIPDMKGDYQRNYYLNNFGKTHNIFVVEHDETSDFNFYRDAESRLPFIRRELDRAGLKRFALASLSFGGLLAFVLIFNLPYRVDKAFIHDYHHESKFHIKLLGDTIYNKPKLGAKNIPIVFYLSKEATGEYVSIRQINEMRTFFKDIFFVLVPASHGFRYKLKGLAKNILFDFFNGYSLSDFWDDRYPRWVLGNFKFKQCNLRLKLFLKIFKRK